MKNKTIIIAEAGINHNGKVMQAKKLIDAAKSSGADIVKFQIYKTELLIEKNAIKKKSKKYERIKKMFKFLKKFELSFNDFKLLKKYSIKKKIIFAATPFDEKSADELTKLNIPFFKISSGDINNFSLIGHIIKKNKPIIISTGRSTLKEIKKTVLFLKKNGCKNFSLLHCVSTYPAKFQDLNLNAIKFLKKNFKCKIGFSDHSKGIEAALGAVALGAVYIEKHLTLNTNNSGPDHKASIEPDEFKKMVQGIRNLEIALGEEKKTATNLEIKGKFSSRRSIFANKDLLKNHIIKKKDIICKRPMIGINQDNFQKIIGYKVKINIKKGEPITLKKINKINL